MIKERKSDRPVCPLPFTPLAIEVRAPDRFLEHHVRASILAQGLPGRSDITRLECVDPSQLDRIHFESLCDPVHVDFDSKLGLRRAESPESPVGRSVREDRTPANPNVVDIVRASSVNASA